MRLRHLALPAAAGLTLLAVPFASAATAAEVACNPQAGSCLAAFGFTGAAETFQVPAGVTSLLAVAGGARGGNGLDEAADPSVGGRGGAVAALVPVTPGETLTVVVGGRGGDAEPGVLTPAAGGFGGGGAGTPNTLGTHFGGGGGGSFVFDSAGTLLLAVGGGGGAGLQGAGAVADGGTGGATGAGTDGAGTNGGGGATTSAGGTAGSGNGGGAGSGPATGPGAFGTGGSGAVGCPAGGGGGGFYGGGSGGCTPDVQPAVVAAIARQAAVVPFTIGGGGGGSGHLGAGVSSVGDGLDTNPLDDGAVVFRYAFTSTATTTTLTTDDTTLAPGQEATLRATVTGPALTVTDEDQQAAVAEAAAAAFGAGASPLAQPAAVSTTVTPSTACGPTACTVTFFVNGAALTAPIAVDPATGVATAVFTAGSDLGVRTVTARYDGNVYYLPSTSNPVAITVAGLANTGPGHVVPLIGTATGLLVVGAGLLAFGRRRPTRSV